MIKKGLAIEGGGAAGLAHLGALQVLEEAQILQNMTHFCGSSAGAIVAAALACKASVQFLKNTVGETNFSQFCDDDVGLIRDTYRLFTKYGWYKGDALEEWLGETLQKLTAKADITFGEAHEKYGTFLEVTVTDVNLSKTIYLSHENAPHMPLKKAVRRSAMIPLFFQADCEVQPEDELVHFFVDGGFMHNYPIDRLYWHLPPAQCLGLKLISSKELHQLTNPYAAENAAPPASLFAYLKLIFVMLRNQALKSHVHKDDWQRTIAIDVGDVSAVDFDMSAETKQFLIEQGIAAARHYFAEKE